MNPGFDLVDFSGNRDQASHLFVGDPVNALCRADTVIPAVLYAIDAVDFSWRARDIRCEACALARRVAQANGLGRDDADELRALLADPP